MLIKDIILKCGARKNSKLSTQDGKMKWKKQYQHIIEIKGVN